jgi:hypothetical protein
MAMGNIPTRALIAVETHEIVGEDAHVALGREFVTKSPLAFNFISGNRGGEIATWAGDFAICG